MTTRSCSATPPAARAPAPDPRARAPPPAAAGAPSAARPRPACPELVEGRGAGHAPQPARHVAPARRTGARDSGCIGLILGLESPNAGTLRAAGKRYVDAREYLDRIRKIQSYGISIWGSFIFGFDTDDWRDCMKAVRFAQRAQLCMSCYPILTPYPGTAVYEQYEREGRLLTRDWDKYNGATVVFQPKRMSVAELRHAQMAAFHEFYEPRSALRRLRLWPLKKNSWLANLAIHRGLLHYYHKRSRPLPHFADYLRGDRGAQIARSLGEQRPGVPA